MTCAREWSCAHSVDVGPCSVVSISFRAEPCVRDEIRGAVATIQRTDPTFSRDQLLRMGARLVLDVLAKRHNDGKAFRKRTSALAPGKRPDAQ